MQPVADVLFQSSVDAPQDENQGAPTRGGGNERSERGNTPLQTTNRWWVMVGADMLHPDSFCLLDSPKGHMHTRANSVYCQGRGAR